MPLESPFPHVHFEDIPPAEWILRKTLEFPHSIALINSDTKKAYTYLEVRTLSLSLAYGLVQAGLNQGDVAAVCLPNCPEYGFIFLALASRGGTMTGINPAYTYYEIRKQLDDSGSKFVFTNLEYLPKILKATRETKRKVKRIYVIGKEVRNTGNVRSIHVLYQHGLKAPELPPVKIHTKTDVVILPYSSGTTGPAKGVMLTHHNITAQMALAGNETFLRWPVHGERVLDFLPFSHMFGFFVLLNALKAGATTITVSKFQPELYLALIEKYRTSMLMVVPPVLLFLAKDPSVSKYDLSCVDSVIVGAAPVGKDLSEELTQRHPNIKYLIQGYGMTETVAGSMIMPPTPRSELKHGSCGLLLPNYQAMVIDPETGNERGPNEKGEICLRGPCTMAGYLGRPAATAATIDHNGWLHTGDIGYYDEEEFFFVVDRLKELIKVRGFQVPPAELEDLLLTHPEIQDVAVIGIPNQAAGELPLAFVVRKEESKLSETEIQDYVCGKVAHYKQLKGGVRFLDQIPKSPSGKILRRLLRDKVSSNKTKSKI